MNLIVLMLILAWSIFWLGYAIYTYNNESFYIRYKKRCTKEQRPLLFHLEIIISFCWSLSGFAMLYVFLASSR